MPYNAQKPEGATDALEARLIASMARVKARNKPTRYQEAVRIMRRVERMLKRKSLRQRLASWMF